MRTVVWIAAAILACAGTAVSHAQDRPPAAAPAFPLSISKLNASGQLPVSRQIGVAIGADLCAGQTGNCGDAAKRPAALGRPTAQFKPFGVGRDVLPVPGAIGRPPLQGIVGEGTPVPGATFPRPGGNSPPFVIFGTGGIAVPGGLGSVSSPAAGSKIVGQAAQAARDQLAAALSNVVMVDDNALAPEIPALRAVGIVFAGDICSGVLVGPRHVLTAAHCACSSMDSYEVVLDANVKTSTTRRRLAQPPILFDPRSCGQTIFGKDLALLILDTSFNCDRADPSLQFVEAGVGQIKPGIASLGADCRSPQARQSPGAVVSTFGYPTDSFSALQPLLVPGTKLTVVGYGYTDQLNAGIRMQVPVPIKSVACLEPALAGVCMHFAEMILADKPGPGVGNDSCGGDSGGPVFFQDGNISRLVAITSRGAPGLQDDPVLHCGGGGIYTIVGRQSVLNWLAANGVPSIRTFRVDTALAGAKRN